MANPCVLALDQGTTNSKALVLDASGQIRFSASAPVPISTTEKGFVEQAPEVIWHSAVQVLEACFENVTPLDVKAIGISNQRETVLFWDRRTGNAVTPAVSWQCRRSATRCRALEREGRAKRISEITGLRIDPLFSASKAEWLLHQSESLQSRARSGEVCMGTIDSWILFKLSGGAIHSVDASNAARTQLLNLSTVEWDPAMLQLFDIPIAALPHVSGSASVYGTTQETEKIPPGISIAAAIGDSHAALFGHGIFEAGPVKATYGTGSSLMTLTPGLPKIEDSLARTIAWKLGDSVQYALEGNITMSGAGLRWVGEFVNSSTPTETALEMATSVSDSGGVYFVPAMNGLGAPYWDSTAHGLIYGLTRKSRVAHLAHAAVESIAHQVADVFDEMQKASPETITALYTDGAGSRNDALMQFQADLVGVPVKRSNFAELSALGAGMLAGLAVGLWSSLAELSALAPGTDVFEPGRTHGDVTQLRDDWHNAVARARSNYPGGSAAVHARF